MKDLPPILSQALNGWILARFNCCAGYVPGAVSCSAPVSEKHLNRTPVVLVAFTAALTLASAACSDGSILAPEHDAPQSYLDVDPTKDWTDKSGYEGQLNQDVHDLYNYNNYQNSLVGEGQKKFISNANIFLTKIKNDEFEITPTEAVNLLHDYIAFVLSGVGGNNPSISACSAGMLEGYANDLILIIETVAAEAVVDRAAKYAELAAAGNYGDGSAFPGSIGEWEWCPLVDSFELTGDTDLLFGGSAQLWAQPLNADGTWTNFLGSDAREVVVHWEIIACDGVAGDDSCGTLADPDLHHSDPATFTPSRTGTAEIRVTERGVAGSPSATILVTTEPPPSDTDPAAIAVTPASATIEEGQVITLSAVVTNTDGDVIPAPVSWVSDDPGVATVAATGTSSAAVTGVVPGSATITATAGGVSTTVAITVLAACEFPGKGKGVGQPVKDRFCTIHPDGPGKSADKGKAGG